MNESTLVVVTSYDDKSKAQLGTYYYVKEVLLDPLACSSPSTRLVVKKELLDPLAQLESIY